MSRLIEETDEYLLLERYIHDDPDSYSQWELDSDHEEKYANAVHVAEHFAFTEIRCIYKIYKDSTLSNPHVDYISFE